MSNILQIGITTEGSTDNRFLPFIVQKTFENLLLSSTGEIELYEPIDLGKIYGNFSDGLLEMSKKFEYFHVICVHCDADSDSEKKVLKNKIQPSLELIENEIQANCKNIVAIIPIYMTESWMLSNPKLLASKIDSSMSYSDLGLPKISKIESISNPKQLITDAIRISVLNGRRRNSRLSISQLYSPISKEIKIEDLRNLNSFISFEKRCEDVLKKLGYLR